MKRKAPWIAVMALMAFSAGAMAAEDDSWNATRNAIEEGRPGPIAEDPRLSSDATEAVDQPEAGDSRVMNSEETRLPSEAASSSHQSSSSSQGASGEGASSSHSSHQAATAPPFSQVDRDSNGVLDAAEANAAGINFTSANQDDDGVVSMREYHFAIAQMGLEPSGGRS